jgi:hypothetical protein
LTGKLTGSRTPSPTTTKPISGGTITLSPLRR